MRRKLAWAVIGVVLLVGLFADCLASDRPLILHYQDRTYWFPNLIDYQDLRDLRGDALREQMSTEDWALWAPVRADPLGVRTAGRIAPVQGPSAAHLLGTDDRGRDVLARLIHGTRSTLEVAAGAALLALVLGVAMAVLGAAWRGRIEAGVLATCDVVAAVPALLVVVAAQGPLGTASIMAAIVLIALPRAADTTRIALAQTTTALAMPYCEAARAMGASRARVVIRHALPQSYTHLAIATALTGATAVLAEAALSFIGFGTPAPDPSWGELLKQAHQNDLQWWLALPAGGAVAVVAGALGALAQPREARRLTRPRKGGLV